jgi:hypothetical protein
MRFFLQVFAAPCKLTRQLGRMTRKGTHIGAPIYSFN